VNTAPSSTRATAAVRAPDSRVGSGRNEGPGGLS
jgi:hypothetical protein